jgi:hypothetical protein
VKNTDRAAQTIVRYIAHPPNPDFEPTEEQAKSLLHELANEFSDYVAADIEQQGAGGQYDVGMKRAALLFHMMLKENFRDS